ncbi:uncharacterized protein LOC124452150 [Xenia sp. Carnegie-2017]|uniref:uncharacterized protein LOC124452150 n=1 Tax=Xenia sp. Carnegie-2017 TaxID=2897299 RepID=UPI001F035430|nr:uncharacterized protein LOC124452150 [Xenia sp. Carnegie-2017]
MPSFKELTTSELSTLLKKNGVDNEVIEKFQAAEIDGELFPTLTREEFSDMFKNLRQKRAAIAIWSKLSGMVFDSNGNPMASDSPELKKRKKHHVISSSDSSETDDDRSAIFSFDGNAEKGDLSDNGTEAINDSINYPKIRLFSAGLDCSVMPRTELCKIELPWSVASPETVGGNSWAYFSAVCWYYGVQLYKTLNYSIGLIATSFEGSPIESWSSQDALKQCGWIKEFLFALPNS